MKLHIFESVYHDLRCVKALAIIPKSVKKGIPRKYQKTWSMKTVAPQFTIQEMKPGIEAEAKRWEQKILAKIKHERDFHDSIAAEVAAAKESIARLSDKHPTPPTSDQPSAPSG